MLTLTVRARDNSTGVAVLIVQDGTVRVTASGDPSMPASFMACLDGAPLSGMHCENNGQLSVPGAIPLHPSITQIELNQTEIYIPSIDVNGGLPLQYFGRLMPNLNLTVNDPISSMSTNCWFKIEDKNSNLPATAQGCGNLSASDSNVTWWIESRSETNYTVGAELQWTHKITLPRNITSGNLKSEMTRMRIHNVKPLVNSTTFSWNCNWLGTCSGGHTNGPEALGAREIGLYI